METGGARTCGWDGVREVVGLCGGCGSREGGGGVCGVASSCVRDVGACIRHRGRGDVCGGKGIIASVIQACVHASPSIPRPHLPRPPSHRHVHRTVTHVAGTPSRPPMSHRHHPEEGTLLPCLMGPDQSGRVAYIPLEPSRFPALPEWEEVRPRQVSTMRGRGPRRDVLHELPGIGCRPACPEHTDASAHRYDPRWKGPAGPSAGGSDALGGSCYALFTGVPSATRLQRGSATDGAVYRRSWDLGWKGAMLCCSAPRALTGCLSGSRLDHARVPPPPAPGPRASRP